MKLFSLTLVLVCTLFFFSCRKDKICLQSETCTTSQAYFPMSVGNYWIYKKSIYNYLTYTGFDFEEMDTVRIIADTFIRGNRYYTIESDYFPSAPLFSDKDTTHYRDSIGYIIDHLGNIKFTAVDFDNILLDQELAFSHRIQYSVKDSLIKELTPAGLFACLDFNGCVFRDGEKVENSFRNYYAKGVGPVYKTLFYASSPLTSEIRQSLYEYHLE